MKRTLRLSETLQENRARCDTRIELNDSALHANSVILALILAAFVCTGSLVWFVVLLYFFLFGLDCVREAQTYENARRAIDTMMRYYSPKISLRDAMEITP